MAEGAGRWRVPPEGLWGFSHCGTEDTWYPWSEATPEDRLARLVADMRACGANSFRPQLHWERVEPRLEHRLARPEDVTDADVRASIAEGRWDLYDLMVDSLVSAGIVPHLVLGAAYDFQLPLVAAAGRIRRATPRFVGRDRYLAALHLHARAAARRYRGRVRIWQLENELNVAGETLLAMHWRSGLTWFDPGFRDAVMEVLCSAVRMEDPEALTSHNFLVQTKLIRGVYDWRSDVARWSRLLDVIGVDSFPNYLLGRPSMGGRLGRKVAQAVRISGGRPVMVLESGYPAKPAWRMMGEAGQAKYAVDAVESIAEAGGAGCYYYALVSTEGRKTDGPWSDRFIQAVEPWWGMVRDDDTYRPSFQVYGDALGRAMTGRVDSRTTAGM